MKAQTPKQARTAGYGRFDDVLLTLHQAVSGKRYLCGDHFTAADLLMASCLQWGTRMGGVPDLPEFKAYYKPLSQRSAAQRAFAMDEALIDQAESSLVA